MQSYKTVALKASAADGLNSQQELPPSPEEAALVLAIIAPESNARVFRIPASQRRQLRQPSASRTLSWLNPGGSSSSPCPSEGVIPIPFLAAGMAVWLADPLGGEDAAASSEIVVCNDQDIVTARGLVSLIPSSDDNTAYDNGADGWSPWWK